MEQKPTNNLISSIDRNQIQSISNTVPIKQKSNESFDSKVKKSVKKSPACAQCRRRKIGCDRQRPFCANCLKYHKETCNYPEDDIEAFNEYLSRPVQHRVSHVDQNITKPIKTKENKSNINPINIQGISGIKNSTDTINNVPNIGNMSNKFSVQKFPMVPSTTLHNSSDTNELLSRSTTMTPIQTVPYAQPNKGTMIQNTPIMKLEQSQAQQSQQQPQQLKFHKVDNAPIYEPPTIISPQMPLPVSNSTSAISLSSTVFMDSPRVSKPKKHPHHNTMNIKNDTVPAGPKITLEAIGAFNTKRHMLELNRAKEIEQRSMPFVNNDNKQINILQSTSKQNDIFLEEMKHLKYQFIELQKRRDILIQQKVSSGILKRHNFSIPIPEAVVDMEQTITRDDDLRTEKNSYLGNVSDNEILSIVNLHTNGTLKLKDPLIVKDTPNSIMTSNFIINRDPYLIKYYKIMENYIMLNHSQQFMLLKDGQINDLRKIMNNTREETTLLNRLIEILCQKIKTETNGELKYFILSLMDVEKMTIDEFQEMILVQCEKTFTQIDNYINDLVKFGSMLIILLFQVRINHIGIDAELEVLSMKLGFIDLTLQVLKNQQILNNDSDVTKFYYLRNVYHELLEDGNSFNTNDEDIYLVNSVTSHELQFEIYRNYINRNLFVGMVPNLVDLETLKSTISQYDNISYKLKEIKIWEVEIEMLNNIQSTGTNNDISINVLMTNYQELENSIKEFDTNYHHDDKIFNITKFDYSNNIIMIQIYYKFNLLINYFLLLQYETIKNSNKFTLVINKLLEIITNMIDKQFIIGEQKNNILDGCELLFMKRDYSNFLIAIELLFSIGLRCHHAFNLLNPITSNPVINDQKISISVIKGKIIKLLLKMLLLIDRNNHKIDKSNGKDTLKLNLQNYIRWLQFNQTTTNDANELKIINNGMLLMNITDLNKLSNTISEISERLVDEDLDDAYHNESKKLMDSLRIDGGDNNSNYYGFNMSNFSTVCLMLMDIIV